MKTLYNITLILLCAAVSVSCSKYSGSEKEQIIQAVKNDDGKSVKKFLKKGVNPNIMLADNTTSLLHLSYYKRNLPIFKMLIDSGADVNRIDSANQTLLTTACQDGETEYAKYLIEHKADIDFINPNILQSTALIEAVNTNNTEIISLLVEKGANLDIVDLHKYSAIGLAAYKNNFAIVMQLKNAGADIHLVASDNTNILDWAIINKNSEMKEYLLSLGMKPHSKKE